MTGPKLTTPPMKLWEGYRTDGTVETGTAPSGASTGEFEALELRDGGYNDLRQHEAEKMPRKR